MSNASSFTQPYLALQAQWAQVGKNALEATRLWRGQQSTTGLDLLHAQLALYQQGLGSASVRELASLGTQLLDGLASQQKDTLRQVSERTQTYLDALGQTQSGDDVGIVTAGYFADVGKLWQAGAEQATTLLNSTSSASSILTERVLDDAVAAGRN